MAVTAKIYGPALLSAFNKEIDIDSDTIKAMLCTSSYTPNQDTHRYKSDVTNEITGTGYTAGGVTLTGVSITYDAGTNTFKIDASSDPSWGPGATITARYLVYYDATPATDATRPLLAYVDFGADVGTAGGTFLVTIDAAGIVTVTVT